MNTRLLSYAELGAALGITPASAKRLAIRRGWAKHPGNDGKARVAVPVERLEAEQPATRDVTSDVAGDAAGVSTSDATSDVTGDTSSAVIVLTRHIERIEAELGEARKLLTAVSAERDAERARAVQVDVLKAVLEAEQRRSAELRGERDRWQVAATAPRGLLAWLKRV